MLITIYKKLKELFSGDTQTNSQGKENSLIKNVTKKNQSNDISKEFIKKKEQSLNDSQGIDDFSVSGYKAPGNIDHEKTNSNMSQRNF